MCRHSSIPPLHPGALLREDIFPTLEISKTELARSLGISRQTLYDILNERQPVTVEMALRFGKFFGNSPRFWINLQQIHDLGMAEKIVDVSAIPTLSVLTD